MISYLMSLALPIVAGYAVARYCDRDATSGAATFFLRLSLAVALAIGLSSLSFFFWRFMIGTPDMVYSFCEMSVFAVAAGWFHWLSRRPNTQCFSPTTATLDAATAFSRSPRQARIQKCLIAAFAVAMVFATVGAVEVYQHTTIGDWDAWAIWNVRARCIFRLEDNWRQAFCSAYSHPDYPLLTPCGNARAWTYLGEERPWTPWMLCMTLTFAAVGMLTAGACRVRQSRCQGLLAGLTLLGMVPFLQRSALQYADVPLACFIFAAVLSLVLHDASQQPRRRWLVLSGLLTGMAAWTKNEGLLFLLVLPSAYGFLRWRRDGAARAVQELLCWTAGVLPPLTAVVLQKVFLAAGNDLVLGQNFGDTATRLLDPLRYWYVTQSLVLNALRLARPFVVLLPLCFLLLGKKKHENSHTHGIATVGLTLALMLTGYFFVYITTPCDLHWHLQTSASRLLLHLLPLGLWILFSRLATPEEAWAEQAAAQTRSATEEEPRRSEEDIPTAQAA